jgi:hypothetical protein
MCFVTSFLCTLAQINDDDDDDDDDDDYDVTSYNTLMYRNPAVSAFLLMASST